MAQAFTSSGDGYVLRGNAFEWKESGRERSPHLDEKSAAALLRDVLGLYQKQNRGARPNRIVVHKTSKFWDEELAGFEQACELVPRKDFVAFGSKGIQFYRPGLFPPLRGSWVKFSDTELMLYSVGYIPYLRTYPGPRVPQPLSIMEHHGDSPWDVVLRDILSLTKMNWNTADFASGMPITIAFSRKVGQILAELPDTLPFRHEYCFYM
jgi:argonaute-like protein implicated in RNA metabolism and viral defense